MDLAVFQDHHQVESLEELRSFLGNRRENKYGAFTLCEERNGWPALQIFINGDLACMWYWLGEGMAGYHSLGPDSKILDETQEFVIDNYQMDEYPKATVIPVPQAIAGFEEFFQTRTLPKAVDWYDLG